MLPWWIYHLFPAHLIIRLYFTNHSESFFFSTLASTYHRMFGVGRDLCGSSSPTPLPKQGHLQQAAQDLSRLDISPSLLVNIFSTVLTRQGSAYAEVEHPTPSPTGALLPRRCEGGRRGIGVRGEHPSPRCSRRACVLHGSQPASRAEAHTGKPRWINAW